MARLTKSDIERELLGGRTIPWRDVNGKSCQITLSDPRKRRLFQLLLKHTVRESTGLPQPFIDALSGAYIATDDPADKVNSAPVLATKSGPWRLKSLKTESFGGLNIWGGPVFEFDFDGESLLLEGPNGSGKSSLLGAVVWALSGERPRDQTDDRAHEPHPVFDANQKPLGDWPPIACYPPVASNLNSSPRVHVELIFENAKGETASATRTLEDGKVNSTRDPNLEMPTTLLEAGLLMPTRLAVLRLSERDGRLTSAVQKLTGLDDLIEIGALAEGLCHKAREYLSYKKKELAEAKTNFDRYLESARSDLKGIDISIPLFKPSDTDDKSGEFAQLGKALTSRAAELTNVISSDLARTLKLTDLKVQSSIIAAIGAAKADLDAGLDGIPSWKLMASIANELDENAVKALNSAIDTARQHGDEAVDLLSQSKKDPKFQLKAVAAQWHQQHAGGPIEACPLCEQQLKAGSSLVTELEALRLAGDRAARTFDDNLNAILAALDNAMPVGIRKQDAEILVFEPNAKLQSDLRINFVIKDRYSNTLVKFSAMVESALASSPGHALAAVQLPTEATVLDKLNIRLATAQRLLDIASWYRVNSPLWEAWWTALSSPAKLEEAKDVDSTPNSLECLRDHLTRLSSALEEAEPYRKAAEAMRMAWDSGRIAAPIDRELSQRREITDSLEPLKQLGSLSESVAREAIDGLSSRIAVLLKKMFVTENFQFERANLSRKDGLSVRGGFNGDLQIDATLVANTSWLRAVLWAFLFSLRAEAVEQLGDDMLPIFAFDDPQATFDGEHRHRWAQQVTELQSSPSAAQILLTTHDEMFLGMIKVSGVKGREAMIAAASSELGHVGIFEGQFLEREYAKTLAAKTKYAGQDYIKKVREYVEGLLRLMLRGESSTVLSPITGFVVGESRDKIDFLHSKGIAPWDRAEFKKLVSFLDKNLTQIKHMEIAHHTSGSMLGMPEAIDLETHWRSRLAPALMSAFKVRREYTSLHGGQYALHAPAPSVSLPEGYQVGVKSFPLKILGRAAALSNGRVADGRLDWDTFPEAKHKKITLAQHLALKLTRPTLEPVARPGDILLVKGDGEPTPKSLVVAIYGDRILARRFELADKLSDVAVLTAHSINPRQIAAPLVAHKASLVLHKIVGVLFDNSDWSTSSPAEMEVCECQGQTTLERVAADTLGLVEVVGHSAVPIVLDKQYIIIKKEISVSESLQHLIGKPVVASDSEENHYFKRLQMADDGIIVLESLDIGGDYPPVVFNQSGTGVSRLERVWPVAGVLFELP